MIKGLGKMMQKKGWILENQLSDPTKSLRSNFFLSRKYDYLLLKNSCHNYKIETFRLFFKRSKFWFL